jgi:hypothetical protein
LLERAERGRPTSRTALGEQVVAAIRRARRPAHRDTTGAGCSASLPARYSYRLPAARVRSGPAGTRRRDPAQADGREGNPRPGSGQEALHHGRSCSPGTSPGRTIAVTGSDGTVHTIPITTIRSLQPADTC